VPAPEDVTETKAVQLAIEIFHKTGRNVMNYKITVKTDSNGQEWLVWFDQKGDYAVPGGKHLVTVNKHSGDVVFMPGE
jgi:hypothetical protein